ncbi:MAG TPA: twin-arginine translocase subunit TatB [Alcanivorax sp.]|jgi:sec-independent protein translocase protein TatB|uniref:Sec-independent protein translocase protein TatB n=1 Tax=Alcanivorax TaxID=59753 RepID=UPI000C3E5696|nr:Sec-independent protein translocase protein TatB [Alcanivorax jadensis]MBG32806.1 twin-arginine translocase subunit TatB [Alcanivorax sp.]HBC19833.1 twin-arginine translocase subunit TatB [Alcanivorax sp.]|tara:strand:+ start:242 stop:529 length:288 start_codon:yes stop_codon:yes gene_type:complete
MLDFGFMEVLLVCVIALVVLGPEKLPRLVRTLGQWLGKGRAMMKQVQQQLESEARNLDMKERRDKIQRELALLQQEPVDKPPMEENGSAKKMESS